MRHDVDKIPFGIIKYLKLIFTYVYVIFWDKGIDNKRD